MDTPTLPANHPAKVYVQMPAGRIFPIWNFNRPDMATSDLNSQIIQNAVAYYLGFTKEELSVKCRKREVVFARDVSMFLHEKTTRYTQNYIARLYGAGDHTAVIHSRNKIIDFLTSVSPERDLLTHFFELYGFEL